MGKDEAVLGAVYRGIEAGEDKQAAGKKQHHGLRAVRGHAGLGRQVQLAALGDGLSLGGRGEER